MFHNIAIYARPHLLAIMLLGMVSGLPLALTASTLGVWLTEEGVTKTAIGLFALIGTPYTLKFLWAPLIDRLPIPVLTSLLGRRRSWLLLIQIGLVLGLIGLGASNPSVNPWLTALFALIVATLSASQDIVIDAYRVERLDESEQGAGAAAVVFGYRVGMLISGAGALFLADHMSWFLTYVIMSAVVPIGFLVVLFSGEPHGEVQLKAENWLDWLQKAVVAPFKSFMQHPLWLAVLAFVVLYKFGDAFAGVMTGPFLIDIGFTKTEIASIVKTYGLAATLIGAFLGGAVVHRYGLIKSLWIGGILQLLSNLMFVWQASVGDNASALMLTITVENLSGGLGTAAFVAYISSLCHREFTATQYALLSALAATGRTWLSASSGVVVDSVGWMAFFGISVLVAVPGLLLLAWLGKRTT